MDGCSTGVAEVGITLSPMERNQMNERPGSFRGLGNLRSSDTATSVIGPRSQSRKCKGEQRRSAM
jgi:hypothetical protein